MAALSQMNPVLLALLAGLFTWACTIFGSAMVFFFKEVNQKLLDLSMGAAAGIMTAAAVWSLLIPSLDYSRLISANGLYWLPAVIGFVVGGLFIRAIDFVVPHLHLNHPMSDKEGVLQPARPLSKTMLLYLAVVIHNIPEGLAVGVAFGTIGQAANGLSFTLASALGLAIGIGIQNIPEGSALSLPLRAEGKSRKIAFYYGALSAIVEPIAAVIGAYAVMSMTVILPYALAFAAGAMLYVVVEELVPGAHENKNADIATSGFMVGFLIMMVLDVTLG